jgi:hypothetical protein
MKRIYKIRHIPTGKFLRIKLQKEGIKVWKEKGVLVKFVPEMGNQLFDTHTGWKTPPDPTNEDFKEIDCEIVVFELTEKEL